jgi:pyruvate,water dikinase
MDYILNFDNVDKTSLLQVGGKNANLGEMIRAGIRVPPGFAVTTESYLSFISETGISKTISDMLSAVDPDDMDLLDHTSRDIRNLMYSTSLSEDIKSAIKESYQRLCDRCKVQTVPVAVRSSATAEDLPTASFAGQQDTYLWVMGADQVIENVQRCWASLFESRAISYRIKNGFSHEKVLISVGVQKMVDAKTAGVMFTLNPTDGDLSKVVIEGSWGLGETVVSGSVNPDKFVVDKVLLETTEKTISTKHIACLYDREKRKVMDVAVAPDIQNTCCLEETELQELVKMGKNIEAHYGQPMDIEWAIDKGLPFPEDMFIVQARPETVWSQRKSNPVIGTKSAYELLMEQAMKKIRVFG